MGKFIQSDFVFYCFHAIDPGHELALRQMSGFSGLLAFELDNDDLNKIRAFFNHLRLFKIGVSWGGHESLIYAPSISYLKELPAERFKAMGGSPFDMCIFVDWRTRMI